MKFLIDNFDGAGAVDYTAAADASQAPHVVRKLNQASQLTLSLVANIPTFIVPSSGARVSLVRGSGQVIFTGYLLSAPLAVFLGTAMGGAAYRYDLVAHSDDALGDQKRLPDRAPFVNRTGGDAFRQLAQDALPGAFDTTAVQATDTLTWYAPDAQKTWLQQAAEIALQVRAAFRALAGALIFAATGTSVYALSETDANFSPAGLKLAPVGGLINDITVIGDVEPQAYVKDYFVGTGALLKFYLSQKPFTKTGTTVFDEEYVGAALDTTRWIAVDPTASVSVSGGKLQIAGGAGVDGATTVGFVEKIELGGAQILQHGDFAFNASSSGIVGGLYAGAVSAAGCLAGFQVSPNGSQSSVQALINGAVTGTPLSTVAGHHYVFTTRLYCLEIYRQQQIFHSSVHPAGSGIGGAVAAADVRVVLEVHDIDPTNPASQVAASTVLYDGVIAGAPGFCNYTLINAIGMFCTIAFTQLLRAVDTEVRTQLPGMNYTTALVGTLSSGAECTLVSGTTLDFFPAYAPAANQLIEVHYRGSGRALARVTNPASMAALAHGTDNGVRGAVRHVKLPSARTASDCENAALALLDDSVGAAWSGQYECWSDYLPGGAADLFPGDGLNITAPSRNAVFAATVREVEITVHDLAGEHSAYLIAFANDAGKPVAFEFEAAKIATSLVTTAITNAQVGQTSLAALTSATITLPPTSTTVSLDAGVAPPVGGGIEVRWSDVGWGPDNDRNLVGRYAMRSITIPRLSGKVQTCFLRQYDASVPPKYSRYSTALHLDYPL